MVKGAPRRWAGRLLIGQPISCDQHNGPPSRASRYRYDRVNDPPGGEGEVEGVGVHLRSRISAKNRNIH